MSTCYLRGGRGVASKSAPAREGGFAGWWDCGYMAAAEERAAVVDAGAGADMTKRDA